MVTMQLSMMHVMVQMQKRDKGQRQIMPGREELIEACYLFLLMDMKERQNVVKEIQ